ncbi:APC family permease [Saccharolobus caldissimus]|uniref:Amino acid permease n=1 Tax=Saccharolobus caldissimus TaxID=1702097 RepID=A0AAQ4CS52_9CREN|nr:APC family permease [Saccharolobus caldissimus]BDB98633.1 amino acid permease [Saccharolobus caldissimus]
MQEKVTEKKSGKEKLTFKDLFFISFGGQAPFISLLTFGTVMIVYAGHAASFAMLIATFVVLFNGLVIYFLTKRFKRGGGYYVYAFYSLTSRLGLNTGWNYLLYALAYGGTLLTGGAYVLYTILSTYLTGYLPPIFQYQWFYALIVCIIASSLVIAGIKVSAKYAMVMSLVEMIIIIILSLYFLYDSGWKFYNPIPSNITPTIIEAAVFGLGIPTGYGSIAPLGYEAESKNIGKAAIAVLLFGGLLSTFFFYTLGALGFTGNLVDYLLLKFGLIGTLIITFIALNDGTLGGMTYILANSRTIRAMAEDKILPSFLSKVRKEKPIYAEILVSCIFTAVITLMTYMLGLFVTFSVLGALAGLNNLFVHISANSSLVRVASKRAKKHIHEIIVGIMATLISLGVFFYSLPTFEKYIVYVFFGWIILGFIYAEGLEIIKASGNE